MMEITVPAIRENVEKVSTFINEFLEENDCPMKVQVHIDIAVDEIFSNVAFYAYENGGDITVQISIKEDPRRAVISFIDEGIKYNPLEKEEPDVTLSANEREIGGLGIFIVKKSMDSMVYERVNEKNILTIEKNM